MTWHEYGNGLSERVLDLHDRVHSGAYRALPSRRVEIPKPDGGTRPLGIAALEDKIFQKAVVGLRKAREMADMWTAEFGEQPGSDLTKLVVDMCCISDCSGTDFSDYFVTAEAGFLTLF